MKKLILISILFASGVASAQKSPIETCDTLARLSMNSSAASCIKILAGKYLSPAADAVCNIMASNGAGTSAVACVTKSVGKEFMSEGTAVCGKLAQLGSSFSGAECMGNIAGKVLDIRFIATCMKSAEANAASSAVSCLKGLVIGDLGNQGPGQGGVISWRDQEFLRNLNEIRNAIHNQDFSRASYYLDQSERLIYNSQGRLPYDLDANGKGPRVERPNR